MSDSNSPEARIAWRDDVIRGLRERERHLTDIGIALASDDGAAQTLETIIRSAKSLTRADGCTLYRIDHGLLHFEMVITDSLGLLITPDRRGSELRFEPIPIRNTDGAVDGNTIAARVAANGETINFSDIAEQDWYEQSRSHDFDATEKYETHSMLTVPVRDAQRSTIAVLQLINAKNGADEIVPFDYEDQRIAECLAAFVALSWRLHR